MDLAVALLYWVIVALWPAPLEVWYAVAIPKVINLIAGSMVLGILLLRWLPAAMRDRTRMQKRIQEAEHQKHALTSALDESEIAVLLLDPSDPGRRIVFANKAYATLTGDALDRTLGAPWDNHLTANATEDDIAARAAIKTAIAETRSFTAQLTLARTGGCRQTRDRSDGAQRRSGPRSARPRHVRERADEPQPQHRRRDAQRRHADDFNGG